MIRLDSIGLDETRDRLWAYGEHRDPIASIKARVLKRKVTVVFMIDNEEDVTRIKDAIEVLMRDPVNEPSPAREDSRFTLNP